MLRSNIPHGCAPDSTAWMIDLVPDPLSACALHAPLLIPLAHFPIGSAVLGSVVAFPWLSTSSGTAGHYEPQFRPLLHPAGEVQKRLVGSMGRR